METVKTRDVRKRVIKSAQVPYSFPPYSLISSLGSFSSVFKVCGKSLIAEEEEEEEGEEEEETTCLTKLAYTTQDQEPPHKLSTSQSSKLQVLSKVLKMKIQVKSLQQGLSQNKESLSILDRENSKLSLYKDQLHQKLRKKFEDSRKQREKILNCCFF